MKTKNVLFSLIVMLNFMACGPSAQPLLPENGTLNIIRFRKPEYKEYIMVDSPRSNTIALTMSSGYFRVSTSVVNLYGSSPYIELPDGYLLIDWKWGRVCYMNNDAIISEKWEKLDDITKSWDLNMLYVNRPVAEYYTVGVDDLKEYNGGNLEFPHIDIFVDMEFSEDRWERWFTEEEKENMRKLTAQTDSAYVEYTEVLTRMINEGKLLEYGKRK